MKSLKELASNYVQKFFCVLKYLPINSMLPISIIKKHDHLILSSFLVDLTKNIKFCVFMNLFKMITQQ